MTVRVIRRGNTQPPSTSAGRSVVTVAAYVYLKIDSCLHRFVDQDNTGWRSVVKWKYPERFALLIFSLKTNQTNYHLLASSNLILTNEKH